MESSEGNANHPSTICMMIILSILYVATDFFTLDFATSNDNKRIYCENRL